MIKIHFTDEEKAALDYERYNHPHPFVRRKMEVVWLKSQGVPHQEICRLANLCSTTVTTYLGEYRDGGMDALKTLRFRRPTSNLDDRRATLEEHFRQHPPASAKAAMAEIERLTGLKRSPESIRQFMLRSGMKCRKVGMVPAKADLAKQDEFKKKSWNRVWKKPRQANARSSSSMQRTSC